MCGIIGFSGAASPAARQVIERLFLDASRRGTHATGVASWSASLFTSLSAPQPAAEFVDAGCLDGLMPEQGQPFQLIGHTRYSTSDLNFNQPIVQGGCALVLNGVLSQEPPELWNKYLQHPVKFATRNDAEIALQAALQGPAPSQRGALPGSYAVLELWHDGTMLAYRNGWRPLYTVHVPFLGRFYASTLDMFARALPGYAPTRLAPGIIYNAVSAATVVGTKLRDFQPAPVNPKELRCPIV